MAMLHESKTVLSCANCGDSVKWFYYVFHEDSDTEQYCIACSVEWYGKEIN